MDRWRFWFRDGARVFRNAVDPSRIVGGTTSTDSSRVRIDSHVHGYECTRRSPESGSSRRIHMSSIGQRLTDARAVLLFH